MIAKVSRNGNVTFIGSIDKNVKINYKNRI